MDSEPTAALRDAPLEVKLKIMLRNWSYPEFREILYREAKEGKDHKEASVYKRTYAYLRALELHRAGYGEVRKIIRDEVGYMPSKGLLRQWLRGRSSPLTRMAVFDVHLPEVGLIMGLVLSDGYRGECYYKGHFRGVRVDFFNKDESLLEMFREACRRLNLAVWRLQCKQPDFGWLKTSSVLLYLLLRRFEDFIVKAPANVQWAFIKGLMLGDGWIGEYVQFCNTDPSIIRTVSALLKMYRIKHSVRGPYPRKDLRRKPVYSIHIRQQSRERFLRLTRLAESPPHPFPAISSLLIPYLELIDPTSE